MGRGKHLIAIGVLSCTSILAQEEPWLAGDCNHDGRLDIGDSVSALTYLFSGRGEVCTVLCDVDQNRRLDINDVIRTLTFLFYDPTIGWPDDPPVPAEICDGEDNDCDGQIDEGCPPPPASIDLYWDAVTRDVENQPEQVTGYRVYMGTRSRGYSRALWAGNRTQFTVTNLEQGIRYYFAVTAVDAAGNESDFSNEAVAIAR